MLLQAAVNRAHRGRLPESQALHNGGVPAVQAPRRPDVWESPDGKTIKSCTIITTGPNDLLAKLHDRIQPYPADLMEAYEVSKIVNSPINDCPECLFPVQSLFSEGTISLIHFNGRA